MTVVFMTDPVTGRAALFDEAPGGGDFDDPNSLRNRPLNDPVTWLANIYFHSDFNYMEVSHGPTSTAISHGAVSASSSTAPLSSTVPFGWYSAAATHHLLTHNLGYIPNAIVYVSGGNVIWPGMPVQVASDGGARYVSVYCTETAINLYEYASTGPNTLPGIGLTYTVIVFKNPPAPTGNILLDFDPTNGEVQMGLGKFNSSRKYLQVVPGGSPFGIAYGRTIDLKNGAVRAVRPDGAVFDPVPVGLTMGLTRIQFYPTIQGGSMGYNGSFSGPSQIMVQAP